MNVLDLFSGIGGFSLGLEAAGMRTAAFCEREPFCQKVLRKHWPEVPIHDDVRTLDGAYYAGSVELVCGGYPCQPFSMAGRRGGAEDERHLWPEMLRIIRGCRPRWIVAENVYGHISLGFDEVAASLEGEGFTVWPFVVPACAVGGRHRRDRLWIVAYAQSLGKWGTPGNIHQEDGRQKRQLSQQFDSSIDSLGSNAERNSLQRRAPDWTQGESSARNEQLSGFLFPCPWPALSQPNVYGTTNGVPNRVDRNYALGNAVVPQIPFLIGRAIMQFEAEQVRAT